MRPFSALTLLAVGTLRAAGQGIGDLPDAPGCDLSALSAKIDTVNSLCCVDAVLVTATVCRCTIDCAEDLLPLMNSCRPYLDALLDMDDGVRDGVAGQLDSLKDQCLALPISDVLGQLGALKDAGTCPDAVLNDVARTEVGTAVCGDTRDTCGALLAAGMRCKDATMTTDCQATCDLCEDGHRRAQIHTTCPLKNFDTDAAAVNTACCDDDGCTGVPTVCDAKCAIVFDSFYDRCSTILGLQIPPDQMQAYTQLYTTCSTRLPIEPLLEALVACNEAPPTPAPPPCVQTWQSDEDNALGQSFTLCLLPAQSFESTAEDQAAYVSACSAVGAHPVGCGTSYHCARDWPAGDCIQMPDSWECNMLHPMWTHTGFGVSLVAFQEDGTANNLYTAEEDGSAGQPSSGHTYHPVCGWQGHDESPQQPGPPPPPGAHAALEPTGSAHGIDFYELGPIDLAHDEDSMHRLEDVCLAAGLVAVGGHNCDGDNDRCKDVDDVEPEDFGGLTRACTRRYDGLSPYCTDTNDPDGGSYHVICTCLDPASCHPVGGVSGGG